MKLRIQNSTIMFLLCLIGVWPMGEPSASSGLPQPGTWISVKKVIDGDTLVLEGGTHVRLLGIDTPELHPSDKLFRDAERTRRDAAAIQAMGEKSYEVAASLVKRRLVRLEYDETTRDKYGRTLAYVYFRMREDEFSRIMGTVFVPRRPAMEQEYMLNRELVRYGWAEFFKHFPYKYKEEFRGLEKQARANCRGLWGDP